MVGLTMVRTVDELNERLRRTTGQQPPVPVPNMGLDEVASDRSAAHIASRIMRKDSPLMQKAETQGRQYGASRGLINSSLAGGAGIDAALNYVVPLAQQEADANTRLEISARDNAAAQARLTAELASRETIAKEERAAAERLQRAEFNFEGGQAALDRETQLQRDALSYDREKGLLSVQIASERELAELDAQSRRELQQMEDDMRNRLADKEIGAEQKNQIAQMTTGMHELYEEGYRTIMNNPDLDAATRAEQLKNKGDMLNLQMGMVEDLYGVEINWAGTAESPNNRDETSPAPPAPAPSAAPYSGSGPRPNETIDEYRERMRAAAQAGR